MCRCAATVIDELERQLNFKLFICHQKKEKKEEKKIVVWKYALTCTAQLT